MKMDFKKKQSSSHQEELDVNLLSDALISLYCNDLALDRKIKQLKKKSNFKFNLLTILFGLYVLNKEGMLPKVKVKL